jgi:hypothetical protein
MTSETRRPGCPREWRTRRCGKGQFFHPFRVSVNREEKESSMNTGREYHPSDVEISIEREEPKVVAATDDGSAQRLAIHGLMVALVIVGALIPILS